MSRNINKNKQKLPEYDGTESLTKYLSKIKMLHIEINKHKYDKILEFMNIWLDKYKIKLGSLTEFKRVSEKILLSDPEHNKKILNKYYSSIRSYLDIESANYNSDNSSTDSFDKLEREYLIKNNILNFIKEILTTINYTLILYKAKGDNFYTIKMN